MPGGPADKLKKGARGITTPTRVLKGAAKVATKVGKAVKGSSTRPPPAAPIPPPKGKRKPY